MRFIVLFVVATIIINIASGLEQHVTSKTTGLKPFDAAVTTKRSLRAPETEVANLPDTDDSTYSEERVNFHGMAKGLSEKIKKLLQKLSNMYYRIRGKTPQTVKTPETPNSELKRLLASEDWVDNEKKVLLEWFQFVETYRNTKKFPDAEIYALLKPLQTEGQMAKLFQLMKNEIPELKHLGDTLQKYQFQVWKDRGEPMKRVATTLGDQTSSNYEIYKAFGTFRDTA
ncbi:Avirulence (Avh) protein [Phytophthora megakarya]|uniref:Avirulence (Avh) protein n=1 Tax=Phytophthora megakarya TaxID=4795 RepID=A0A225UYJ6_9STRA|nr:Avirulence (Avh) protein [Phytophthora megakarya]